MVKILVTGANGQVGNELQHLAAAIPEWEFVFTDYQELDITDKSAVLDFFNQHQFSYCLNCAAYTAVDKAESEPDRAMLLNVTGVEHLAAACAQHGAFFIQLSTDYVYHNAQNTPFKEDDAVKPQSVYARTKYGGDLAALSLNPASMVIRTSWVYSSFGHNFVKTMLRLGKERPELGIIFDQIGTPTYARDLAAVMLKTIDSLEQGQVERQTMTGVFHYSNEGVTSWYDFALAIFEMRGISCHVKPIETKDYPTPATRPPFSLLNKGKIKAALKIEIPHWRESLKACLHLIEDN